MSIKKAGVIGAGAMGSEITQVFSAAGIPVLMKDVNDAALQKGMARIQRIYKSSVEKGRMTEAEAAEKLKLVTPTTTVDGFKDVEVVVEAVPELWTIKAATFKELDQVCPKHAILATNTSSLSVSRMAALTSRPDRVVGMHFFNPAHVMKLVEVVPGLTTSADTVAATMALSKAMKKIPVQVKECPGFLVNRMLLPYLNEAAIAYQEGAASLKTIDEAMVAFGWPMGPFTLMDMLGIDVCAEVARILLKAYGPRVRAAEIFDAMVAAGRLGQKNGAGFYDYSGETRPPMEGIADAVRAKLKVAKTAFSVERLMMVMVNEAVMCVQEGISSPEEVDVAMVAGTGFPQEKKGPLHYADAIGVDVALAHMERLAQELGGRFWPHFRLPMMAGSGALGVKTRHGFFPYTA